jgi:hypothetical protein
MTDAGKFNFGVVDCSQKPYLQLSKKKNYHVEEIPATTADHSRLKHFANCPLKKHSASGTWNERCKR